MAVEINLTELTALIVASYVSNNQLEAMEVPALIASTHAALSATDFSGGVSRMGERPAVPVEQSIAPDYLICLNDGKKLRSLRRYLRRKYSLSPAQYRCMWGLPDDYPMVAPAYSKLRATIAKRQRRASSGSRPGDDD